MANPQKDDGHTGINNEVLEKLLGSGLNGTELSICLLIIRKTWGFNKLDDEISLSQFMSYIPSSKQSIVTALSNLQLVKIIRLVKKGASKISSNKWKFNKNYDEWQLVKKTRLVKNKKLTSQENLTHKRNIQNKNKINISNDIFTKEKKIIVDYSVLGFTDDDLKAFKEHRKAKKAAPTQRAINIIAEQLKLCEERGVTRTRALNIMISKNWQGLEAEWILRICQKQGGDSQAEDFEQWALNLR